MRVLEFSHPEVVVAEGVADALTLIQMGTPQTLALVGVQNIIIMEAVVRAGKDVAIALDNDARGKESTVRIVERLQRTGFQGNIRYFTDEFLEKHPEAKTYKDFNKWWQEVGAHKK